MAMFVHMADARMAARIRRGGLRAQAYHLQPAQLHAGGPALPPFAAPAAASWPALFTPFTVRLPQPPSLGEKATLTCAAEGDGGYFATNAAGEAQPLRQNWNPSGYNRAGIDPVPVEIL